MKTEINKNEFLLDLANVLEKHGVYLVSPFKEGEPFVPVGFLDKKGNYICPDMKRCHVSAYDLRVNAGMSSNEANEMYKVIERLTTNKL